MNVSADIDSLGLLRLCSLREDVHLEFADGGSQVLLHSRWRTERVIGPDLTTQTALRRMALGPVSLRNILDGAEPGAEERLTAVLCRIQHLVVRSIGVSNYELPLLSLVPLSPGATLEPSEVEPDRPVRLSRFASLRTEGRGFTVESPLSLFRASVHRGAATELVGALGWTTTPEELVKAVPLPETVVLEMLAHLLAAGIAVTGEHPADEGAETHFAEDTDPALSTWSPIDLLFHTRATTGRHDNDFGATFAHTDRLAPEPAVKAVPEGPRFPLPHPAAQDPARPEPTLTDVLEGRIPLDPQLTAGDLSDHQIGELLYRSLRVRSVSVAPGHPLDYQVSDRPYASVSGSHPLEAYVAVNECTGLPRGIFHYDPVLHSLTLLNQNPAALDELFTCIQTAAGLSTPPKVNITLTARFPRVTWKYSGLGYALALRDTGMALQTLHLVAAAMGLPATAIGSTEIDIAPKMAGLDWRAESPVGQLALGGTVRGNQSNRLTQ